MDRRTFMKAAVVAASTPAAAWAPPAIAASLPDLIERHRVAIISDRAAWDHVADIDDMLFKITGRHKRQEDEASGYTAALSRAKATSDAVKALEAEIVVLVPASLEEAARKTAWIAWAYDDDYCYIDDHEAGNRLLIEALQAIGRAVV